MKTDEIPDELRNEIIAAVEAANVSSPAEVCDWVLDAAASGQDWRAELDRAATADEAAAGAVIGADGFVRAADGRFYRP